MAVWLLLFSVGQTERVHVEFTGQPIRIEYRPGLRAWRGKLLSGGNAGSEVHAASFLRERLIVLDSTLSRNGKERDRILAHELFHFAWWRAGNPLRVSYEHVVRSELLAKIAGEAGWSAEWRKDALEPDDRRYRTRRWREYICESFCDTGALLLCELDTHHEMTLPRRAWKTRRDWFEGIAIPSSLKI